MTDPTIEIGQDLIAKGRRHGIDLLNAPGQITPEYLAELSEMFDKLDNLPADMQLKSPLSEFRDLTQAQIDARQGKEIIGRDQSVLQNFGGANERGEVKDRNAQQAEAKNAERSGNRSFDQRRSRQAREANIVPSVRPNAYEQILQDQVNRGEISPAERDRFSRTREFLVKQGLAVDTAFNDPNSYGYQDPQGLGWLMEDMGLGIEQRPLSAEELATRKMDEVYFDQTGTASIPAQATPVLNAGDQFLFEKLPENWREMSDEGFADAVAKVRGGVGIGDNQTLNGLAVAPGGATREVPQGTWRVAKGSTPGEHLRRRGKGTKSVWVNQSALGTGGSEARANSEAIRRLEIGLAGTDPSIVIPPERRDEALRLLGDLQMQGSDRLQLEAERASAGDAIRGDIASGLINREAEARSIAIDREVGRTPFDSVIYEGTEGFDAELGRAASFGSSGPAGRAIQRKDGVNIDADTRLPVSDEIFGAVEGQRFIDADGNMVNVPEKSAGAWIINNYTDQYDNSSNPQGAFNPVAISQTLDDLTLEFEKKGASIGRPIRTANDLEEASARFIQVTQAKRGKGSVFFKFDPETGKQNAVSDPDIDSVFEKLKITGGRKKTIAKALWAGTEAEASGIQARNVNAIRRENNSIVPRARLVPQGEGFVNMMDANTNVVQTGRELPAGGMGATFDEAFAVGPIREVNLAGPGAAKVPGSEQRVSDALAGINVEANRRVERQAALDAEADFLGRAPTTAERREALGGIRERNIALDLETSGRDIELDAQIPLIGKASGDPGGAANFSALYIPDEGRTLNNKGEPRQTPVNKEKGRRLKARVQESANESAMVAEVEKARRAPFIDKPQRGPIPTRGSATNIDRSTVDSLAASRGLNVEERQGKLVWIDPDQDRSVDLSRAVGQSFAPESRELASRGVARPSVATSAATSHSPDPMPLIARGGWASKQLPPGQRGGELAIRDAASMRRNSGGSLANNRVERVNVKVDSPPPSAPSPTQSPKQEKSPADNVIKREASSRAGKRSTPSGLSGRNRLIRDIIGTTAAGAGSVALGAAIGSTYNRNQQQEEAQY